MESPQRGVSGGDQARTRPAAPVGIRCRLEQGGQPTGLPDPNAAFGSIEQALRLPDLTSDQLDAIAKLLDEYDRAWNELSSRMSSMHAEKKRFGANTNANEEAFDEWRALDQRYRASKFERNEASLRALRRLSRYLQPDQRLKIRGLRRIDP
jgi:hypothetical protein